MKPYMIEITAYAVVMAEDASHARAVALVFRGEIMREDSAPLIDVQGMICTEADLRDGWDGKCIPYGGDGSTTLADLLAPNNQGEPGPLTAEQVRQIVREELTAREVAYSRLQEEAKHR